MLLSIYSSNSISSQHFITDSMVKKNLVLHTTSRKASHRIPNMYIKQVVHEYPIAKGSGFDFRRPLNKIFWSSCLQIEFVSQLLKIQLSLPYCTYNWSIFNYIGLHTNFVFLVLTASPVSGKELTTSLEQNIK